MVAKKHANNPAQDRQPTLIEELRQMRRDANRLSSSLVEHLKPFQKKNGSFKTLPDSRETRDTKQKLDISVASTCTVLMAAIAAGKHKERYALFDKQTVSEVFTQAAAKATWGSSGLNDGNAFTTAIVVRSAGSVVEAEILTASEVQSLRHAHFEGNEQVARKTLKQIVQSKAKKGEESFKVEGYPPKTTHAYWFVDGAIRMEVNLPEATWTKIALWASTEFHRQLIYVSAGNDALMDPPSLAMAACLISRIRRLSVEKRGLAQVSRMLPSTVELEFGIEQVFSKQSDSGIWPRYFPLFHFPRGGGAADYCFSFEFLEAILVEFGTFVLRNTHLLERIKRALRWCDTHELEFTASQKTYRGWNSGGEVKKLAAGMSESWATASVHMFLTQLNLRIGDLLDELVLKRFGLDRRAVVESSDKFERLIDAQLKFSAERPTTLKRVIKGEILKNVKSRDLDPEKLIGEGLPVPRSALLFGPPGTSKSRLAKAIAEYLGWPLVVVTPSEFLRRGVEQVHAQVDEVFRDLMDLRRAVVFFDEMDALAQTREGDESDKQGAGNLDITRQLLTTSMLPKLANLWEQKRVIFLMATNHKQQLDPAITRPNRFDLLLCVAPPSWADKCTAENLETILKIAESEKVTKELLRLAPSSSYAAKRLNAFTVAEIGIFLHHFRRQRRQSTVLGALKQISNSVEFGKMVNDWAATSITLRSRGVTIKEFGKDFNESRRQYYPQQE
jgi:hypothetical protein